MSDLHIPQSALDEHMRFVRPAALIDGDVDWQSVERQVRATSTPVVAVELRRFADEFRFLAKVGAQAPNQAGVRMLKAAQDKLTARADELDGGAS